MTVFTDVMVDIESTGNQNYERYGIIQIAAVKFNYKTEQVDADVFDRCLRLHPGREWDVGTRQWWAKQGNVLAQIEARAEDPHTVIHDFYQWLLKDWPSERQEGRQFWAKPTSFDHPFLVSYFKMFGYDMPCLFRYCRDLNSFMAGLKGDPAHPDFEGQEPQFQGDQHNALHDTLHQIRLLFAMKHMTTQGVILPPLPKEIAA